MLANLGRFLIFFTVVIGSECKLKLYYFLQRFANDVVKASRFADDVYKLSKCCFFILRGSACTHLSHSLLYAYPSNATKLATTITRI